MNRTSQMTTWLSIASCDEANAAGLTESSVLIKESGKREKV